MPTETLSTALVETLESFPEIVAAFLFGSQGRETPHRESDVDLGILFDRSRCPTSRSRFDAGLRVAGALMARLGRTDIDLVVLNEAPPLLARHVVTHGRRLLCLDRETEHAFRRDTLLRAGDLAPFLERHRRALLETLAGP